MLKNSDEFNIRWLLGISLLLRIIPMFAIPALSDDFYRFIWDGRLLAAGINPFAGLPGEFLNEPALVAKGISNELYGLLNSPTHYTIYPPVPIISSRSVGVLECWNETHPRHRPGHDRYQDLHAGQRREF